METNPELERQRLRAFQFSLRSLILVMFLAAVVFSLARWLTKSHYIAAGCIVIFFFPSIVLFLASLLEWYWRYFPLVIYGTGIVSVAVAAVWLALVSPMGLWVAMIFLVGPWLAQTIWYATR